MSGSLSLTSGLLAAMSIAGTARAEGCTTNLTQANTAMIREFVHAADHDYELGDQSPRILRERANKFMSERYLQHHPGVESGREAFVQFHIKWYHDHPPQPPKLSALPAPPDTAVADCDTVLYMHHIPRPDPSDPRKIYASFLFDLWRVKDGKADEHWDSFIDLWRPQDAEDASPEGKSLKNEEVLPQAAPPTRSAPVGAAKRQCSAERVAANRQIIGALGRAWKVHSAPGEVAANFIATNYVEHSPSFDAAEFQGREGFVRAIKTSAHALPGATLRYGTPEIVIADCEYLATVKTLRRSDFKNPGVTFKSYWFDLWKVSNGRLAEHWDATLKDVDYHWADVDALNLAN